MLFYLILSLISAVVLCFSNILYMMLTEDNETISSKLARSEIISYIITSIPMIIFIIVVLTFIFVKCVLYQYSSSVYTQNILKAYNNVVDMSKNQIMLLSIGYGLLVIISILMFLYLQDTTNLLTLEMKYNYRLHMSLLLSILSTFYLSYSITCWKFCKN